MAFVFYKYYMTYKRQIEKIDKNSKLPFTGNLYKKNKNRISFFKFLKLGFISIAFLFIFSITFYIVLLNNKTNAESLNQETVLKQLSKSIILPQEEIEDFQRISNAKDLANQEEFYKDAKNGDYIIVYHSMALIYNFDEKLIKNIKTK